MQVQILNQTNLETINNIIENLLNESKILTMTFDYLVELAKA